MSLSRVLAFRFELLSWSRHQAILMVLLQLAVMFDKFSRIVVHRFGNTSSCITHGFDGWIIFHGWCVPAIYEGR
jgi:hypothetical protein